MVVWFWHHYCGQIVGMFGTNLFTQSMSFAPWYLFHLRHKLNTKYLEIIYGTQTIYVWWNLHVCLQWHSLTPIIICLWCLTLILLWSSMGSKPVNNYHLITIVCATHGNMLTPDWLVGVWHHHTVRPPSTCMDKWQHDAILAEFDFGIET